MSDISKLAHVLRQYEVFRKGPAKKGSGDFHKGLIHLRNVDQDRVAERVLQRDWHNRKAIASMFKMAESVERLLHLKLDSKERRDLGRLLISSLCYAELYRVEREDEGDIRSPYYIVRTGESLSVDNTPQFSKLMSRFNFSIHISREWSRVETLARDNKKVEFHKNSSTWIYDVHQEIENYFEIDWTEQDRILRGFCPQSGQVDH